MMNKTQKTKLAAALEQLRAVRDQVQVVLEKEEELYENMHARQVSSKGEERATAIECMKDSLKAIKRAGKAIKDAMASSEG
jgi:hypothetical protein